MNYILQHLHTSILRLKLNHHKNFPRKLNHSKNFHLKLTPIKKFHLKVTQIENSHWNLNHSKNFHLKLNYCKNFSMSKTIHIISQHTLYQCQPMHVCYSTHCVILIVTTHPWLEFSTSQINSSINFLYVKLHNGLDILVVYIL